MYLRHFSLLAAVGLGFACGPAWACEFDPFLFQLPGETVEAAQARADRIMSDDAIIRKVSRENYAFEKASTIYLARKVATVNDPKTQDRVTTVHPVHTLRGLLPQGDQHLRIEAFMGGMCGGVGDGDTAHLPVEAYVVIFEGLPRDVNRPRGIDSFDVNEIRNEKLLDALRLFGKDLE